ncbi:MAG: site-specific DNA-methyltransferase [Chloroflexi bacterium]|nr:site-specific DNA-methyltransferase [Chloroflexota bacterium]
MTTTANGPVADYRYDETRKNNPPAALAARGRIAETPKQRYYYDPHLPPTLRFDDSGESDRLPELLAESTRRSLTEEEARVIADALRNREPWLEWTGKREKRYFEVDPVALHIHERVSAQAAMRVAARQDVQRSLWADPQQDYHEAVQFYRHDVEWSNRLILGDSLLVMNSLAKREDLAGKVQMIYIDPPYGISYRSNFQPFVRDRNVRDREQDLTREPEMVKAYRDTWALGIHTYLTYLRDRLTVARELLSESGSVFVQIGDENVHRIREVMDEVLGRENFVSQIYFATTSGFSTSGISRIGDYLIWYARNKESMKYRTLFVPKGNIGSGNESYRYVLSLDGARRSMTKAERDGIAALPDGYRVFRHSDMQSSGAASQDTPITFEGKVYRPLSNSHWKANWPDGLNRLESAGRLVSVGNRVNYVRYTDDYPVQQIVNSWMDTGFGYAATAKQYVVQTHERVIQRCLLMTTDPGDLVLDPTCGAGTTAYVAEQWGRRWITIDTSRVAIALARQRILTAKFDYYKTADDSDTISDNGFKYKTVPHITLRSIAQNVALDPIFTKWEPVLDDRLDALNAALGCVDDNTRVTLLAKLETKSRRRPRRDYPITDADERRWNLPKDKWEHWEVPFDADDDYPANLRERLEAYRKAWREKMAEVNACIAANADQETLVDQPEVERGIVRVSGPFTVEAVQPAEESLGLENESPIGGAPDELDSFGDDAIDTEAPLNAESFKDSVVRLLRHDGMRFHGNGVVKFTQLEAIADGGNLHAEGEWESDDPDNPRRVAVSVGPQHGPVTATQVEDAIRAAYRHSYDALVFAGITFDGAAQAAIQDDANPSVRMHMAHIAPDIAMNDLLKETRDRELFSVSGLPRTKLTQQPSGEYVIEMDGVDIYDPVKNAIYSENARGVAAWFLDSDYDGRTFCITQAFFPDSKAWNKLAGALKSVVEPDAFAAFSGTKSLPFPAGRHKRAAVKVIDPRGNEVMKVHALGSITYDTPDTRLNDEFNRLVTEWKVGRSRGADVTQMVDHPAYQQIVGMGEQAIPLILEELEREVDHWFPALRELTGTSPVPEESKGNLSKMRDAWLNWGKDEAYI